MYRLVEAFFNMSLRSACFIYQIKSKISSIGTTPLRCQIIRIPEVLDTSDKRNF
jgi:hypothetical protein